LRNAVAHKNERLKAELAKTCRLSNCFEQPGRWVPHECEKATQDAFAALQRKASGSDHVGFSEKEARLARCVLIGVRSMDRISLF
jgi:hypothetical protein